MHEDQPFIKEPQPSTEQIISNSISRQRENCDVLQETGYGRLLIKETPAQKVYVEPFVNDENFPGKDDVIGEETPYETKKIVAETVYFSQVLDEAANLILEIAPNLKSISDEVLPKILLTKTVWEGKKKWKSVGNRLSGGRMTGTSDLGALLSKFGAEGDTLESQESMEDWFFKKMGDSLLINVNRRNLDIEDLKSGHAFRVVVTAHELLHAFVSEMFGFSDFMVSSPKAKATEEDLAEGADTKDKEKKASLGRVLLEGMSLALEHEVLTKVFEQDDMDEESQAQLKQFAQDRLDNIKQSNKFWSKKKRQGLVQEDDPAPQPEDIENMSYSEGTRIALALRRQGWSLNDLPELVAKVKVVVESKVGSDDPDEVFNIGVSREEDSIYKILLGFIKDLSKDQ